MSKWTGVGMGASLGPVLANIIMTEIYQTNVSFAFTADM